ncbi:P-loop containing nucleoside triphosphate hydrolase protein [Schizothecium vesticola]|uniref:P-loop containing nucleoside triphosphate hydrolase protein n=1 Tax=Schizothecium vesticola TaxID=314040 RepID=A0AA40EG26_9PEZI|nr:P-loop containing nucleoside triphosphate hydrolase protein [Schizothecium vesticola]
MGSNRPPSRKRRRSNSDAGDRDQEDLERQCNSYEKSLLSSRVRPGSINVTYDDVQVHESIKTSLQNLTLPLRQPHEFAYGVLAKNAVPGVLLYGPPGTGKTLLAKAVAQESGASMLEITAASVQDMFVGESEKNIRSIFSLARKLSPCVIFIDEADGLFAKRDTMVRQHERTALNQFLCEWDGLSGNAKDGAIVILSTNRPFDLDDAILRRVPRRLFVDMPQTEDRRRILEIHLADEQLAPDVDLNRIVQQTTFYSGSDLKNLVIEAATRCVHENMIAHQQEHQQTTPPGRRILRMSHFQAAKSAIRPGISSEGLAQVREFHTKFGNTSRL